VPLADRLAEHVNRPTSNVCLVGALYQTLSPSDQAALDAAMEQVRAAKQSGVVNRSAAGLSASALYRAIRAEGYQVSLDVVTRHTFQRCACVN
jgi:DNA-binding phage protein